MAWRVDLPAAEDSKTPAWLVPGDAHVFVSGPGAVVSAFNAADGRVAWASSDRCVVPPVTAGVNLAIVTADSISVVDQASGHSRWRTPLEDSSTPILAFGSADRVAIASDGGLQAWNAADGTPAWRVTFRGRPITNIVTAGTLLVFGTDEPALVAIDATAGTVKWKIALPDKPGPLVASATRIYFGGEGKWLYSYHTTGEPKLAWRQERIGSIGTPVVDDRAVYFALLDNSMKAFSAGGGTQQWDHVLESRPLTGPLRLGDTLGIALTNGRVAEVAVKDGKQTAPASAVPGPAVRLLTAAAAIDGSRIYTVTIAVDESRALVVWAHPAPHDEKH